MGLLTLKSLNRNSHPQGGETLVIELGDTELIVEYTADHRDIRVCDATNVVKIRLNQDCSVRDVLKNDQFLSLPTDGQSSQENE